MSEFGQSFILYVKPTAAESGYRRAAVVMRSMS
jgi:hypothetical protein